MISRDTPSTIICWPRTFCEAPKRVRQIVSPMKTTGALPARIIRFRHVATDDRLHSEDAEIIEADACAAHAFRRHLATGNRQVVGFAPNECQVGEAVLARAPVEPVWITDRAIRKSGVRSRRIDELSGCGYGNGRSRTALTTLKMAVFAPMPRARASMAMIEKPAISPACEWRNGDQSGTCLYSYSLRIDVLIPRARRRSDSPWSRGAPATKPREMRPTEIKMTMAPNVIGSHAPTPKSSVFNKRVAAKAPASPITTLIRPATSPGQRPAGRSMIAPRPAQCGCRFHSSVARRNRPSRHKFRSRSAAARSRRKWRAGAR